MACGCPVVVSNTSSLPEVCGDAGYYFDPHNTQGIADAIATVLDSASLRRELSAKGLERAKQFSYEKTADQLIALFNQVLST